MAHLPVDGSKNDIVDGDASGLLAEVAALRDRLAALEAQLAGGLPAHPPPQQASRRISSKTVVHLTTGAILALLAGASVVYGQSAVEALLISKEGNVAIGPSGALFVGKEGNVAIGPSRLASSSTYKLQVSTGAAKTNAKNAAGFAVTTNETDNPFGLGIRLNGAPALADRSAVLVTTDVNLGEGGHLVLQPSSGNVGIGTLTPKAENKLEVNGKIAANSLTADSATVQKSLTALGALTVEGDTILKGTLKGAVKIDGNNVLELGAGVKDKEGSAGIIAYEKWTTGALDIVGAGSEIPKRKINFWAEGGATFAGGLKVNGAVDGNMKVVYQRDDDAQTTYEKPLWRYHMSLTAAKYGGRTKTIPNDVLTALCGKSDGCEVRLGMTRWDDANKTQTASITNRPLYRGSGTLADRPKRWQ